MPVLVNKQTGLAEDLPEQQAHAALYAGTHDVPVVMPDGQLGSSPFQDAQRMVSAGEARQPSPEQLNHMLSFTKHSGPLEQAKTFAEGAAEAASFGLSTPIQVATGISTPEDIQARREINPKAHMAGQISGLLGSLALPGGAAAGAMKALGEGAEAASSLTGLAGAATRLGAEGAAFQAGDELSKKFSEDPNQTMQSAAANIGMSALMAPVIGGAFHGLSSLSESAATKLGAVMGAIRDHVDLSKLDMPGAGAIDSRIPDLLTKFSSDKSIPVSDLEATSEKAITELPEEQEKSLLEGGLTKYGLKALKKGIGWTAFSKLGPLGPILTDMVSDAVGKTVDEHAAPLLRRALSNIQAGINPEAFNAVLNTAQAAARGLRLVDTGVRNVLSGKVGEFSGITDSQLNKLEKAADIYRDQPDVAINNSSPLGAYEPAHATADSAMKARAMEVINNEKPQPQTPGMFDRTIPPSKSEMAAYKKTAGLIEDPLSILNHIHRGDLTPKMVTTHNYVYPDLHKQIIQTFTNQLIDRKSKDMQLPYKQRLSLSMYMGMPLDSTMSPQFIAMNQPQPMAPSPNQPQKQSASGSKALDKLAGTYQTSGQAREAKRIMK